MEYKYAKIIMNDGSKIEIMKTPEDSELIKNFIYYKGFYFEDSYDNTRWRIEEKPDRTGHSWIANKDVYPTKESCLAIIENDENYQYYLKYNNVTST